MTDTKTLVKELRETKRHADIDLEALPYQTRASLTSLKRDAQERYEKLKTEYFGRVRSNTLGVFLFGEPARVTEFARIASEEAGMVVLNGAAMYEELVAKVEPSLGPAREFGPTQLQGLLRALSDLQKGLDIRSMVTPRLSEIAVVPDTQATVAYVRKLVRDVVGDDLLRVYLDRKVNEAAVEMQFAGNTFPVAVTGLEPSEVASLAALFSSSHSVEVGTSEDGEVTQQYVLKQLEALKPRAKSKTNNK